MIPFAQHGVNIAFDLRVSATMITLSFTFTFCNKDTFHIKTRTRRANNSQQVSPCRRPEMECHEKTTFGSFVANSLFNLVTESSIICSRFFPRIKYLVKLCNYQHACLNHWRHHVHNRSAMRDGVSQQTPHDQIGFCDECCSVGYFVLLSSRLSSYKSGWREP